MAGQNQSVVVEDVIHVRANRRQDIDRLQIGRSEAEVGVNRVAVDEQRGLAETQLAELALKRLGLGVLQFQRVEHDQLAVLRLCRQEIGRASCRERVCQYV